MLRSFYHRPHTCAVLYNDEILLIVYLNISCDFPSQMVVLLLLVSIVHIIHFVKKIFAIFKYFIVV